MWHAEEQFRLLVESAADYAIFMLDPQGNIVTWNVGAERIKGYKPEEIIGRHFSCFYPPEDRANGKPEKALRTTASEGRYESEGWRIRKDGSRFWANVVMTALRDDRGNLTGFSKITRDLTERREMEQALRQLSSQVLRAQDEERRRLGRDLHDSVGQYLAALKMRLDSLEPALDGNDALRREIADCVYFANESMKELRTASYELYPPMLDEVGLKSAVPWYLDGFMTRSGITTTLSISSGTERPPSDVELAVFRVLQESLTNVRRHSNSRAAAISLQVEEGVVRLEVADQGTGIPPEILQSLKYGSLGKLGVGLRGMQERVEQLGGTLEVSSSGKGTTIRCAIPWTKSP